MSTQQEVPTNLLSDGFAGLPDQRATHDPNGHCLTDSSQTLTNARFLERVQARSGQLASLGIGDGDVVGLQLPNSAEFVVLVFAAWRLGATVTPLNPNLTPPETEHQLRDSNAELLINIPGRHEFEGITTIQIDDPVGGAFDATAAPRRDPSALALLIYTSGTTGRPKGVMLDHTNILAMVGMGAEALEVTEDDRCLLFLPLFHVNALLVSVLVPLAQGADIVITERFQPAGFSSLLEQHRPSYFSGVPTVFAMLTSENDEQARAATRRLRFAVCGAAPAPPLLLSKFEADFGVPVLEGYGLSEGTCASTVNPLNGLRKAGTVGLPFPGQLIRIASKSGQVQPIGLGIVGEIQIKGANVMRGYLGLPDETARTIVDGWLNTGDLGLIDTEGYLTIVGRSKDMIIRGGENIYPKEIEDVLARHPAVIEAAVVGEPDSTWGEIVVAFLETRSPVEDGDLADWCSQSLGRYKTPARYEHVPSLPRNAMGKVDKKQLKTA